MLRLVIIIICKDISRDHKLAFAVPYLDAKNFSLDLDTWQWKYFANCGPFILFLWNAKTVNYLEVVACAVFRKHRDDTWNNFIFEKCFLCVPESSSVSAEFINDTTKSPDIRLLVVGFISYYFGRAVWQSAVYVVNESISLAESLTDPKISQFNIIICTTEKNILRFEVCMNDSLLVYNFQSQADLYKHFPNSWLTKVHQLITWCLELHSLEETA